MEWQLGCSDMVGINDSVTLEEPRTCNSRVRVLVGRLLMTDL